MYLTVAFLFASNLVACSPGGGSGPRPILDGDGFFGSPFPSDLRTVDGHPDLTGFPNRDSNDLLELYASDIETLDGFGTNTPIWIPLSGSLDTALLPDPAGSMQLDSPILLVDVDPDSPTRGTLVPWSWALTDQDTTFQPANLLSILPLAGSPLHPNRTYALVLTTDIAQAAPGFADVWEQDAPDHDLYQGLQETLFQLNLPLDQVAAATVFTTQNPLATVNRFVQYVRNHVSLQHLDQPVQKMYGTGWFNAYEGTMWLPIWQHGEKPYVTEGGGFEVDDAGVPILANWESVTFRVSIPRLEDMPATGWPVVIYGHGTGGDQATFANGPSALEPAAVLAKNGLAGIGISLPLHGDRGTGADPKLLSFNYFNPTAARGNFQQAVLDLIYLVEVVKAYPHSFDLIGTDGQSTGTALFDPDHVAYVGHSHGGIIGAMAAPWLGDRLPAIFLSGAGGGVALAVQYQPGGGIDIQDLLSSTFDLDADELMTPDHPLMAMVQTLAEAIDPLNYAPYWSTRQPWWDAAPASVLMTTGLLDENTPTVTSQILAGAGGLPILDPVSQSQPINELLGLVGQATPTRLNLSAWDGTAVTGGIAEFPDEDHYPIFTNSKAAALYAHFIKTGLTDSSPQIDLDP
ncbi:MAG: hypothetical protein GXP62_03535 [Oligoflexia bacterium]|nr:hypothetical protein [Oligoflexia bacterium]